METRYKTGNFIRKYVISYKFGKNDALERMEIDEIKRLCDITTRSRSYRIGKNARKYSRLWFIWDEWLP